MTDPISTGVVTPISQLMQTPATTKDKSSLDKDAFLKLLVAQLKYQDPSKPVDSSEFMAQTAQFTQVEKLEQMAKDSTAALSLQQGLAASSLVGKPISWVDAEGASHQGVVQSATFGGSLTAEPTVTVGGQVVPLSQITTVRSGA
ncbi:flagellar hook capping FlgD N-terminal domain-containing protein [Angustibacter peucedani]